MNNLELICDYKDIEKYRLSFNELANTTFDIDFEKWYQKGFWNDRYICYSYADGNKVVANVSISKMDIILEGKKKKSLQIGTVMTHPDYRKRGLSAKLISTILGEHEENHDFIYLFANKSVLDFYPKFGFKSLQETQYSMDINTVKDKSAKVRKLDMTNINDLSKITKFASERTPISNVFGVENGEHILLWYCVNIFYNNIYYLEDDDAIVIYEIENNELHLYDVISKKVVDLNSIITGIVTEETKKVVFHFTPDPKNIDAKYSFSETDDAFFVKPLSIDINTKFKYPITAQA
ncbi:GNAT family N-acetyltransferase [Wukongibacter baidiensis]|uniref:GNAT family N-acetyltransferase n=1 Tax=Wukongibacter baidiensis TaxID=1723361 RepID=UPI003D7F78D6